MRPIQIICNDCVMQLSINHTTTPSHMFSTDRGHIPNRSYVCDCPDTFFTIAILSLKWPAIWQMYVSIHDTFLPSKQLLERSIYKDDKWALHII